MSRVGGIYQIRHLPTGRIYVGSTISFHRRWIQHRSLLNKGGHTARRMQNAWNRDGQAAFVFEILERVDVEQLLLPLEQVWIDWLKAHVQFGNYNVSALAGRIESGEFTPDRRAAAADRQRRRAKSYVVTWPDGHTVVVNPLSDFCAQHGLTAVLMRVCARGLCRSHKGFSCRLASQSKADWEAMVSRYEAQRVSVTEHSDGYPKTLYVLTHPDGREEEFVNLTRKSEEIGVAASSLHALARGVTTNIRGYKLRLASMTQAEHDANCIRKRGKTTRWELKKPAGDRVVVHGISEASQASGLTHYELRRLLGDYKGHAPDQIQGYGLRPLN